MQDIIERLARGLLVYGETYHPSFRRRAWLQLRGAS